VPQIPKNMHVTSDQETGGTGVLPELLVGIARQVISEYRADDTRVYMTGQSLGCIAAFALNIMYPGFFAASYMVAGQWHKTEDLLSIAHQKMFMINSDGDMGAYPGMNKAAEAIAEGGGKVERFLLNAKWEKERQEQVLKPSLDTEANVVYATFTDTSVVPEGVDNNPISNHMNTWPAAYDLDTPKEWLFSQKNNNSTGGK
jgi:predicted peptidase